MELKDYVQIIKKNLIMIIVVAAILGLAAYFVTLRQEPTYNSTIGIEITREQTAKQAEVPYYLYDNYYATQVATTLSDNIIGWLSAPSFVSEILTKAGYEAPSGSLREISKTFTAKKKISTSSVVDISYSSTDSQKAEKIIQTAASLLRDKTEALNSAKEAAKYVTSVSTPVVITTPKPLLLNTLIGVLVGLFLSVGYAFLKNSA
ncbi:MAG: Wzz/FepE/Etk N-terminal domain-containing protein [Candidatus Berkelbacteria bacterium]|nr:Wzz/FepE/Etk N-terminal domain-containing protein [Candidatus Berkelbacteria bacterium]